MKRLVVLILMSTLTVASVAAQSTKVSPDLQRSTASHVQVVVQYNNSPGLLDLQLLSTLGSILNSLPLLNAIVADLPLSKVLSLANQSNVKYVSLDRPLSPTLSNAAPAVNAFAAWQSGYTGAGIGVALIDSGVSSHPDLNGGFLGLSRVVWNQSFVQGNSSANDSSDTALTSLA
jgi:serine protease AprX